ncbi:MAG TPA: LytTR family DNA-binding domain-containing protein [Opitutus sp.]|nr:LytTR family DNA-binding domain-containing protein [Opitutus sp.]
MNPTLRTLIVDDERLARKRLRSLLTAHPEIAVIGEAATVREAAAVAALEHPALVLLDVQMPPDTGFDLLPLLPSPPPAIVFTTAHDVFAVRAFEVSAVDYLLKPVSPERLAAALERVRLGRHSAPPFAGPPLASDETLILQSGDRVRRVALTEIAAVAADGHYSRVYLANEPAMFVQRGINSWAAQLPEPGFLRVDRSLIVNLARVRALDVQSRDAAALTLAAVGGPLALGRSATSRLRAALAR